MKLDFDPAKSERNARLRELPFDKAIQFEWETALFTEDTRKTYPEKRFVALGYLGERLHIVCFTPIEGGVRIISFRKANSREARRYEEEIETFDDEEW